jgi:PAS domain S-box-containing protein
MTAILCSNVAKTDAPRKNRYIAWIVLGFGLMIAVAASLYMKLSAQKIAEQDFIFHCEEIQNTISNSLSEHARILQSAAALFHVSDKVTHEKWSIFNQQQKIEKQLPGIQCVGFSPLIPHAELTRHIQEISSEGFPEYGIRPDGDRENYAPVIYMYPVSGLNLRVFGFDTLSEPVRRAAMERARDTDSASLSAKVVLVQEAGQEVQAGTVMYVPVYRKGMPTDTVEQRRSAIIGWVYSAYRMNDLMKGILARLNLEKAQQLHLSIHDGQKNSPQNLLYECQHEGDPESQSRMQFTLQIPFDFNEHSWALSFAQSGGGFFAAEYTKAWLTLSGGTLIAVLLFMLIRVLQNTRAAAQLMAEELSVDLRKSKNQYASMVTKIPVGVYMIRSKPDGAFAFEYVSPKVAEIFNVSADSFLADPKVGFNQIHPDDLDALVKLNQERFLQARPFEWEGRTVVHGALKWLHIESSPETLENGDILWNGVVSDISARKEAEESLIHSHKLMSYIIEHNRSAIAVHDRDMRYIYVSKRYLDDYKVKEQDVIGKHHYEVFPDLPQKWKDVHKKALAGEISSAENDPYVREDGTVDWTRWECRPWYEADGSIGGIIVYTEVITERKRVEEEKAKLESQLRHSQKMDAVGQLAGGISHDFNNLLSVINGYSQVLLMDPGLKSTARFKIEEIQKSGERAAGLTRQLLMFSRQQPMDFKIIDLNAIVADISNMLRRLITENIDMAMVGGVGLWRIKSDPGHMEQVIMNLVINARDAMPEGGKLTIETRNVEVDEDKRLCYHSDIKPGSYVMLSISDSGCGMDANVKEHLFEPFFTTKELGKGTGLGLATVYGIVRQSNAYIDVQSEPGKGASFRIYFPKLVDENTAETEQQEAESMPRGAETILIAEDEESIRNMLQSFLQSIGYTVFTACNGKEALRFAEAHKNHIHLLLADIVMPGMNGFELAKHMEPLFPEIKLLFMSGYARADDPNKKMNINDNFIEKPINLHALAVKLRKILGDKG